MRVALFEPHERFIKNESGMTQYALFGFEKKTFTMATTIDKVLTTNKGTTLGSSKMVSNRLTQEMDQKQTKNYEEVDPKYNMEEVK